MLTPQLKSGHSMPNHPDDPGCLSQKVMKVYTYMYTGKHAPFQCTHATFQGPITIISRFMAS